MAKKVKIINNDEELKDILNQEGGGIVPMLSEGDLQEMMNTSLPDNIPLLVLRNIVLFPGIVVPVTIGRHKSLTLIEEAYKEGTIIGTVVQKDEYIDNPKSKDLYKVGTSARILKLFSMPDGTKTVLLQGLRVFSVSKIYDAFEDKYHYVGYFRADVEELDYNDFDPLISNNEDFKATIATLVDMMGQYFKLSAGADVPDELLTAFAKSNNNVFILNFIASNLPISTTIKQRILETTNMLKRADMVLEQMALVLAGVQLKAKIQNKAKIELDKQQKEYFLNQQMKAIQDELGENGQDQQLIKDLKKKAKAKKWDKTTQEHFDKELEKLQRMHPASADMNVQLNYLEALLDLPWNEYTRDSLDLAEAQRILDEDHFGLAKIKERIIEHLAVLHLRGDMKAPILCFVGPPGVGKTSLGKAIARAMNRKYVRMSLGGVRDEAEIRGHRKTYIGAMPGRIVQNLQKAGSANPVFVLDEIDKLSGMNGQGDPSAAMLEVLDPEQNTQFNDNYIETPFDLSHILFIATANTLSTIPPALRDRMEIIELSSYLLEEKIMIAKRHLIPQQIKANGLKAKDISFSDKIIEQIISDYTREAGVRTLEKMIAKIVRHRAFCIVGNKKTTKAVKKDDLAEILGVPLFKRTQDFQENTIGVAKGLAWTSVGGEVLFVETAVAKNGKGGLVLTGNLGDVMKESATIAYEYIKSHADTLNTTIDFANVDVYVHVPEGATPKDGPSAGITMLTAMTSVFTNTAIRPNVAMTGEISLRGKILPVGGIKEKILAAKRENITTLVLPAANRKDVEDIEKEYISGLNFHYFENVSDALAFNLGH